MCQVMSLSHVEQSQGRKMSILSPTAVIGARLSSVMTAVTSRFEVRETMIASPKAVEPTVLNGA